MKEFSYTITDPVGIHARPAGNLVKAIKGLSSAVTITNKDGRSAPGGKLMALMGLGVKCGETVKVALEGPDEAADAQALERFFQENL